MTRYLYLDSSGVIREGELPSTVAPSISYVQEYRPLTAEEGEGKFFTLANIAAENSLVLQVSGVSQFEHIDYTVETVNGEVRVQFIGQLGPGGISEVVEGDVVNVRYALPAIDHSFEFQKQTISLRPVDVENQFFTLPLATILNTETIIAGGTTLIRGLDYTIESMGTEVRVVFAGTLAQPEMDAATIGEVFQAAVAIALN